MQVTHNVYEGARLLDESEVALPLAEIWGWSEQTFGDGLRTKGVIQHVTKELKEIEEKPFDLEEWTDLILLSLDGFWRHCDRNLTKQQMAELLSESIAAKFAKNQARDWPDWRTLPDDVAIEHKRGEKKCIKCTHWRHDLENWWCEAPEVLKYNRYGFNIPSEDIIKLCPASTHPLFQALKDMEGNHG